MEGQVIDKHLCGQIALFFEAVEALSEEKVVNETNRNIFEKRLMKFEDAVNEQAKTIIKLQEALKHNNEVVEKIAGRLTEDIQVYIRDRVHMFRELDELKLRLNLIDGGFPEEKKKVEVVDETHSNE